MYVDGIIGNDTGGHVRCKSREVYTEEGSYLPVYLERVNGSYGQIVIGYEFSAIRILQLKLGYSYINTSGAMKWEHGEMGDKAAWVYILKDRVSLQWFHSCIHNEDSGYCGEKKISSLYLPKGSITVFFDNFIAY